MPADQIIYGCVHIMTRRGSARRSQRRQRLRPRGTRQRFDLNGVNLEFFDDHGRPSGELTSRGRVHRAGLFVARGHVVLITQGQRGNRALETEELHYDPNGDQIWSPVPFVMREGGRRAAARASARTPVPQLHDPGRAGRDPQQARSPSDAPPVLVARPLAAAAPAVAARAGGSCQLSEPGRERSVTRTDGAFRDLVRGVVRLRRRARRSAQRGQHLRRRADGPPLRQRRLRPIRSGG
jgi:hypothetical protein